MILIAAIQESYRSLKDGTLKIIFETQVPTPEQVTKIALSNQKFGYLAFSDSENEGELQKIMEQIPKTDLDFGKTKGQRLRGVLYKLWEQNNRSYEVFDDFYNYMMERAIEHYKKAIQ
jgi:hypothetical protein